MGAACSTHWGPDKQTQNFLWKTCRKILRAHLADMKTAWCALDLSRLGEIYLTIYYSMFSLG